MTSSDEYTNIAIGAILVTGLILAALYVLRRLRLRRAEVRSGGARAGPALSSDRAYNRLAMARREADLLQAQGADVARARELLTLSDRSYQAREFDRAFELAQSAHETLVTVRRQQLLPGRAARPVHELPIPSGQADPEFSVPTPAAATAHAPSAAPVATAVRFPKNKLESQFQLHLFETELAGKAGSPPAEAARPRYDEARAAFEKEEYTEALRLALKGRRQLGGAVETLGAATPVTTPGRPAASGAAFVEPMSTAERAASSDRCVQCGHPLIAGDAFCRGCGASRSSLACPQCGAARTPADTFCGKCGARFA